MENLLNQVSQQLNKWPQWHQAKSFLLALSGGVDSVVLLDLLDKINRELDQPKRMIIAHFNHQLRPTSDQDAAFVRQLVRNRDYIYYVTSWDQPAQKNIEAAGRQARYQFFADIVDKEQVDILFTGHHLNDLAETILMRLTRGTSLRGLRGIEPNYRRILVTSQQKAVQVQVMRPLLAKKKEMLYDYAKLNHLAYVEDESNQDPKFFRNRIRSQVLPMLMQENNSFLENILVLQDQLQASYRVHYANYLQDEPRLLMYSDLMKWVLYVPEFAALSPDKRKVYLAIFCEERLVEDVPTYTKEAIDRIDALILNDRLPNSSFQLSEQWQVRREYDYIYIQPTVVKSPSNAQAIRHINQLNHWHRIGENEEIGLFDERYYSTADVLGMDYYLRLYLKPHQLRGFYLRHRKEGDRLVLNDGISGGIFRKKVSRYMIDEKIPLKERDRKWLLCDELDQVVSIIEHISSRHYQQRHPQAGPYYFLYRRRKDGA